MRSAKFFEQEGGGGRRGEQDRRPRGQQPDWFLHDDRDAEPRAAAPRRAGPPAAPAARMWEYKDLDGQTHGPFSSEKMRQWAARGYFQSDLQVRQAGGAGGWSTLSQLMPQMSDRPAPKPQRQPAEDRRASAFERLASGSGAGDGSQVLQAPRRGGGRREVGRGGGGRDGGRGPGRDGANGGGRRGGREGGRGGRGQRCEEHGGPEEGRQRQRGGRGGRGEGKSRGAAPKMAQAKRLFTNNAALVRLGLLRPDTVQPLALAADQPLWRYVDLSGAVQGPFTAANMTEWYLRGYLGDENLMLIGHDRQVAPPNLPPLKFYQPLGKLLEQGENYVPLTAEDLKRDQAESAAPGAGTDEQAATAPIEPSGATADGKHETVTAADNAAAADDASAVGDATVADTTPVSATPADEATVAPSVAATPGNGHEAAPDTTQADAADEPTGETQAQAADAAAEQAATEPEPAAATTSAQDEAEAAGSETVPAGDAAAVEAEPAAEPADAAESAPVEGANVEGGGTPSAADATDTPEAGNEPTVDDGSAAPASEAAQEAEA